MGRIINITENQVRELINELNLYHGSKNDFDKFNHKKYLSSGAGSQVFGWGTYLTDSYEVAAGYAKAFIAQCLNSFIAKAEPLEYLGDCNYDKSIINNAVKLYKRCVRMLVCTYPSKYFEEKDFDVYIKRGINAIYNEYKRWIESYGNGSVNMGGSSNDENAPNGTSDAQNDWSESVLSVVKTMISNVMSAAREHAEKKSYIYEVEIPDDNGKNYLSFYDEVPREIQGRVIACLARISGRFGAGIDLVDNFKMFRNSFTRSRSVYGQSKFYTFTGEKMMKMIDDLISSERSLNGRSKAVALFLMQCGLTGIKYPAGTRMGLPDGAKQGSMNYVIFNANDIKITSKNLFRLTEETK